MHDIIALARGSLSNKCQVTEMAKDVLYYTSTMSQVLAQKYLPTSLRGQDIFPTYEPPVDWLSPAYEWQQILILSAAEQNTQAPALARFLSLCALSQYAVATAIKQSFPTDSPIRDIFLDWGITHASFLVISYLLPIQKTRFRSLADTHKSLILQRGGTMSIVAPITALATDVAHEVIQYGKRDGADSAHRGVVQHGIGKWRGDSPVFPGWGHVTPNLISIAAVAPPPPPPYGSPPFVKGLEAVRRATITRSTEQVRFAAHWGDGVGTTTPPGHWHAVFCKILSESSPTRRRFESEYRKIAALMIFNIGIMDAGIACWDAKYKYCLIRPYQADKRIVPTFHVLPQFPAYVSGHSTFSSAAATIISVFYEEKKEELHKTTKNISHSRVISGLHYYFDCIEGEKLGNRVACIVIDRMKKIVNEVVRL